MAAALDRDLRDKVEELADRYDPDPRHAAQVTRLALRLFDCLRSHHGLGARERELLAVAGMLHDIGWSRTTEGGHHKHSQELILEAGLPGLDKAERKIVALVARYHRKSEPDPARHRRFALLGPAQRNAVEWLAGILRVADGLDRSHEERVEKIRARTEECRVRILVEARNGFETEVWGAVRKMDLLQRKLGKELVFERC